MLLDENPLTELTDMDGTNLVRMLRASAKKAVGERIVPATDNRKMYYNKGQKVSMSFLSYHMLLLQVDCLFLDRIICCIACLVLLP